VDGHYRGPVLEAAFWGFVGGAALLVGALMGLYVKVGLRTIGLVMAFGAGVLISAVAFELTEEAFQKAGSTAAALGLAAGALTFFVGDWLIDRHGGHRRKSPVHGGVREPAAVPEVDSTQERARARTTATTQAPARSQPTTKTRAKANATVQAAGASSGLALVLGALLDGIPESAAIGISLLGGGGVGVAMVAAVFLSNIPESLSATTGLKASGRSAGWILRLWALVVAASTLAAVLGYVLLGDASQETVAFIQTFAAGAILTMLADTMMPEAVEHAGRLVGLLTVLGFAVAFFLSSA
jgi:zinc transporter, ZIP family